MRYNRMTATSYGFPGGRPTIRARSQAVSLIRGAVSHIEKQGGSLLYETCRKGRPYDGDTQWMTSSFN